MKLITDWYWFIDRSWQDWDLKYEKVKIHFFVALLLNNSPIFVVCKIDDPTDNPYWCKYIVQLYFLKGESIMYLGRK